MRDDYPLPQYKKGGNESDFLVYLADLRTQVFRSHKEAANYFCLNRTSILRYESEKNIDNYKPPPIGYLAGLLKKNMEALEANERARKEQFTQEMRTRALAEVNTVIFEHYPPYEKKMRDWGALCQIAEAYILTNKLKQQKRIPVERKEEDKQKSFLPARSSAALIGRDKDFKKVTDALRGRWPVIALVGIPGVGKTTLATEVAHYCLEAHGDDFPHPFTAVAWKSARGRLQQEDWFEDVLDRVMLELKHELPVELSIEEKQEEVSQLLRTHRTLVLLDNFETMMKDAALVDWLEQVPEPSKVLLTSRIQHIHCARRIHLDGLTGEDAIKLIHTYARDQEIEGIENQARSVLLELIKLTEGNPKVIEMALGHVDEELTLPDVVEHLARGLKSVVDIMEYMSMWAWEALSPEARMLLLVVPFFTNAMPKAALAQVSGLAEDVFQDALRQVLKLSMLNKEGDPKEKRYSVHPIVRVFLLRQSEADAVWEMQARQRWANYYVDFLEHWMRRDEIRAAYWEYLGGGPLMSIRAEWPNLQNVIEWVDQQGNYDLLLKFILRIVHYLDRRAFHPVRLTYAVKGAAAALALNKIDIAALFYIDALGVTWRKIGEYEKARAAITAGQQCIDRLDSRDEKREQLQALSYAFLAKVLVEEGKPEEAAPWIEQAMALREQCIPVIHHRILVAAGDLDYKKQSYETAKQLYLEAVAVGRPYSRPADTDMAGVYRKLGYCSLALGDPEQAAVLFQEVISYKTQGGELNDAYASFGLAQALEKQGQRSRAQWWARKAKKALETLSKENPLLNEIEHFLKRL